MSEKLPRFVKEGYAEYNQKYVYNKLTRKLVLDENGNRIPYYGQLGKFDFIGVIPSAPDWAKQEYEEYIKMPGR